MQSKNQQLEERLSDLSNNYLTDVINELKKEMIQTIKENQKEDELLKQKNTTQDSEMLSRVKAAEFLSCSLTTLYYYQKKKMIPYYQLGRKILFKKSELLQAMNNII
ncbi:MAG: helix-turn-helix domain-containing protein [Bacteroidetes bacterium]|nr:helix-turn-helix domain-containing protein [Bacteroidota bacterium]